MAFYVVSIADDIRYNTLELRGYDPCHNKAV